ncbi:penicillin-binding protein activator [Phytohalomonas tamaricis]|uniref:penicillin-binding protein activator n=1 Tax=Phytohalomonas tamaricis TaxID=2081032 RepID=UPI000D0B4F0A|nr:penicillin-binding protein activator [Phytohalomonas tamaricis]
MRNSLRRLTGITLAAFILSGCAGQSIVDRFSGPSPQELLTQAQQQQGSEAAQTRLHAADILARQGDNAQALQILDTLDEKSLPAESKGQWALLTTRLALAQEDGQRAFNATQVLDQNVALSSDERNELRKRRGLAQAMLGHGLDAAITLIQLQGDSGDLGLNDDIWRQLTRLSPQQLDEVARRGGSLASGWVDLANLRRERDSDIAGLFNAVRGWQASHRNHPASQRLPQELSALQDLQGQEVHQIAVFLPESGPLQSVADAIREGIRARSNDAANQGESAPQIMFYDTTGGDIDALYAQAMMEGAQVAIGPLDKDKVSQLEMRSNVPIPTLALNYGTHADNSANNLFQYGLSAEDEARQAAHRAYLDGHRSAGIMVPDNDWGSRVLDAFRTQWQYEGGSVGNVVIYDPKAAVASSVKSLLGSSAGSRNATRNIDMLFLLALPNYARQVPPTLDYYYASNLPIYGTSHLYDGQPQPRLDHDLNGVLFCDIPWQIPDAAVGGTDALPFSVTYQHFANNDQASLLKLHAMGVDAYELARRLPILNAVPGSELYGATGMLKNESNRRIRRTLPWAEFRDGIPQPPSITATSNISAGSAGQQ